MTSSRPPHDVVLYREGLGDGFLEYGQPADGPVDIPTLGTISGYALQWGGWADITEGGRRFQETFARGSLDKTIRDRGAKLRLLYAHGNSDIGDRPLGPVTVTADDVGLRYTAPLLDTSYNRDLAPPLKAGLMGSSVRFSIVRDQYTAKPKRSDRNPDGIPERVVTEARLYEISAVTFPAYSQSTATLRSSTDAWTLQQLEEDPVRFEELRAITAARRSPPVPDVGRHSTQTLPAEVATARFTLSTGPKPPYYLSKGRIR